jgi:hypothetical protein
VSINDAREEEEPAVHIDPSIAAVLKKHQLAGVRFLWDCTIFSLDVAKTTPGRGAILVGGTELRTRATSADQLR